MHASTHFQRSEQNNTISFVTATNEYLKHLKFSIDMYPYFDTFGNTHDIKEAAEGSMNIFFYSIPGFFVHSKNEIE